MRRSLLLLALCACGATQRLKGGLAAPYAPAGVTDAASAPRRYALVLGVNAFEDERFTPLKYAAADATAMGEALAAFDEVTVLATPETTSRASVLTALAALRQKASRPQDTAVIYVSSHGSLAHPPGRPLERYVVLRDTRLDLIEQTGLSVRELTAALDQLGARRKALILAMCHSGKGKSQVPDALASALAAQKAFPRLEEVSEAQLVLTACAFGESAREDEALGHDVYTHYLLEALKLGDRDGDGAVTASEAHDYARSHTYERTSGQQRPTTEADILGRDPIVLAGRVERTGKPLLYSYARAAEGLEVRWAGQKKGVLPGAVAVEAGEGELELYDTQSARTVFRAQVQLGEGEQLDLANALPRPMRLEVSAGAVALAPLTEDFRGWVPAAFGAQASIGVRDWPAQGLVGRVRASARFGRGAAPGLERYSLPFSFQAVELGLGLGPRFELRESLALEVLGSLAGAWLRRDLESEAFRSVETTFAGVASVAPSLHATLGHGFALWAALELGAMGAGVGGGVAFAPVLGGGLGVTWAMTPGR